MNLLNPVNSILKEHDLEVIFDITAEANDLVYRSKGLYSSHEIEAAFFLIRTDGEVICYDSDWGRFMRTVERKFGEIFMTKTRLSEFMYKGSPDNDDY